MCCDGHLNPGFPDQPGLSAPEFYARLTQRLIGAITAPTAEGRLYDVDMRLRPTGRSGSLVTPLDEVGSASFRADLASMRHETQYTRLFRS